MMLKASLSRCVWRCVRYCMFAFVSFFFFFFFFCLVLFTWHKTDKRDIPLSQNFIMKLAGHWEGWWRDEDGDLNGETEVERKNVAWHERDMKRVRRILFMAESMSNIRLKRIAESTCGSSTQRVKSTHQYQNMIPPFSLPFPPLSVFSGRTDAEKNQTSSTFNF